MHAVRRSTTRSRPAAAALAAAAIMLAPVAAYAQSCAVPYRKALDDIRDKRAEPMAALVRNMRAADPQLTGRWLFSAALFDPARKPKTERVCAETTQLRNGRSRCNRFETRTIAPPDEPAMTTASSPDELKDLKSLAQFVEGKGAVPELGTNGRFGFLFQRVAQDLRGYLLQEPHPALCAGGADLTEFYDTQLAPLKRRIAETSDLAKRTRASALARLMAIHKAEAAAHAKALAAIKAASDVAAQPNAAPATASPPAPPAPPPAPANYEEKSLIALVAAAVRPLVSSEQNAAVAAATSPFPALAAARTAVLASQASSAATSPLDPTVRDAVGHALRMLEAAAYAEQIRNRYADVDRTMFATNADIRQSHKLACTCKE